MRLEQHWRVERFAAEIKTARAGVNLIYAGCGRWMASSSGLAQEISLPTPGGENWPRLERLMRVLAAVGIVQAKVMFRDLPPSYTSDLSTGRESTAANGGRAQYLKVVAFSERTRLPGTTVELELGCDDLWYASASSVEGRHTLSPVFGDGWGRLEGLLQILAGAGIGEAFVRFQGIPPAQVSTA